MNTTTLRKLLTEAILETEGTASPMLYYTGKDEIEDEPWSLDQSLAIGWGLDFPSFIAYTANRVYYQDGYDGYCTVGSQPLVPPSAGNMLGDAV